MVVKNMNNAYITLVSSMNYIEPAIILSRALKDVKTKYPLIIMVTEDIFDEAVVFFKDEEAIVEQIPFLHYARVTEKNAPYDYIPRIASKMACFMFKDYDKMVYLDADCIVLRNMDDLFNYPDGAMYHECNMDGGFAGMYVFCPRNHHLEWYMCLLQNFEMWESELLKELWFPFKTNKDYQIPEDYFQNITNQNFEYYVDLSTIKCLHFCYFTKPWKFTNEADFLTAFYGREDLKLIPSGKLKTIIHYYFVKYLIPLRKQYGKILLDYSLGDR